MHNHQQRLLPVRTAFKPATFFKDKDVILIQDVLRKPCVVEYNQNTDKVFWERSYGLAFDKKSSLLNLTRAKVPTTFDDVVDFNKRLDDALFPPISIQSILAKPGQQERRAREPFPPGTQISVRVDITSTARARRPTRTDPHLIRRTLVRLTAIEAPTLAAPERRDRPTEMPQQHLDR